MEKIFQEGDDWWEVRRMVWRYVARLGAMFMAVLALLSAILYHAVSILSNQAWSFTSKSG